MLELLYFSGFLVLSSAFKSGAPEEGCYTSRPLHDNFMPQWQNVTFALEFAPKHKGIEYYVGGEPLQLTLKSLYPETLKLSGYLITVWSSSGMTGGTFTTLAPDSKSIPQCGITHTTSSNTRTEVSFTYTPPTDMSLETIQFKAIAVASFSVFWDNILSFPINMKPDTTVTDIQMIIDQFAQMANLYDFSNFDKAFLDTPTTTTTTTKPPQPSTPAKKSRKSKSRSRSKAL